ncbi:MAG: elongation factor P [Anaeroplasmataceae bacterium]
MVSSNDFKTGITIQFDGNIYSVIEFLHVKPGKGAAFVRTKLRNLRTQSIVDHTFNAGEKISKAVIDKVKMQYLYNTGNEAVLMDNSTFEQIEIPNEKIKNELNFIKEGLELEVVLFETEVLGINLPDKVVLKIVKCDPAIKGDTKTNALKDAVLESGLLVKVPMFVEEGEEIIVSTQTSKYDSRA